MSEILESQEERMESDAKVTIRLIKNGPVQVQGSLELSGPDGKVFWRGDQTFLCRCGHSENKPFCDGAHNRHEWDPSLAGD